MQIKYATEKKNDDMSFFFQPKTFTPPSFKSLPTINQSRAALKLPSHASRESPAYRRSARLLRNLRGASCLGCFYETLQPGSSVAKPAEPNEQTYIMIKKSSCSIPEASNRAFDSMKRKKNEMFPSPPPLSPVSCSACPSGVLRHLNLLSPVAVERSHWHRYGIDFGRRFEFMVHCCLGPTATNPHCRRPTFLQLKFHRPLRIVKRRPSGADVVSILRYCPQINLRAVSKN